MAVYYGLTIAAGFLVWQAMSRVVADGLLPSPVTVAQAFRGEYARGTLVDDVVTSVRRVALGFVFGVSAAVPIGFLMGWYRWGRGLLEPWVQFFRTIPALALIPLYVLMFGIGEFPKVLVIAVATFLPTVVATYQGVLDVDGTLIKAARVLGAGDGIIFRRVVVPASLPFILVGARLALGNAWGTLVAAELIASSSGLGFLIQRSALYFEIPSIFVAIILIGVIGLAMDRAVALLHRKATHWQERR
ncbi:MAG: ABC transporter permease [Chloroflexi bacterium]|nr:ABC transporter permease [Chloroflexota bacterium]